MLGQINWEIIVSSLAAIVSAIGLLFVGIQTKFHTKMARAQFIDGLGKDVDENIEIESALEPTGHLYDLVDIFP